MTRPRLIALAVTGAVLGFFYGARGEVVEHTWPGTLLIAALAIVAIVWYRRQR